MVINSTRSEAEDHLLRLLQMVNEWLRFAEAKNAGLLALSGLAITAVLSFVVQVEKFDWWSAGMLIIGSVLWVISILITASSFLPKTDLLNVTSRLGGQPEETDNLYYYGHLIKLDATGLLEALNLNSDATGPRYRFERDLADQVIANSRITNDKLNAFQLAAKCWSGGLVLVAAGVMAVLWS